MTAVDGYLDVDSPILPLSLAEMDEEMEVAERAFGETAPATGGTVVVDGTSISLRVKNGCLEIVDGIAPKTRRVRTITREQAGSEVRRIVVLGPGTLSVDALAWCQARQLPLVVMRAPEGVALASGPQLADIPGLRRAQALAPYRDSGMAICRWLIDGRLVDQARICERLGREDRAEAIQALRRALYPARDARDIMLVEGRAATHYWGAWEGLEIRFHSRDQSRVPEHWRKYRGRASHLERGSPNRHASHPINAILNYSYKIAESEATLALLAAGLDPGLGWLHADVPGRPSASLDLLEAARGIVETAVLDLVERSHFKKIDFREDREGQVWVRPPLTHEIVAIVAPKVREHLAKIVEELAEKLAGAIDQPIPRLPISVTSPTSERPVRWGKRPSGPQPRKPRPSSEEWEELRAKLQGLSAAQIGAEVGVSRQQVWRWQRGQTVPSARYLPGLQIAVSQVAI